MHSLSMPDPFLERSNNLLNFIRQPDFYQHILMFHSSLSRYQSPLWEINPGCLGWELQRWTWSPDPLERLSDWASVHLRGPPWQAWPRTFQPGNTVSVRGQHSTTIHPLTYGHVCWTSVPSGILCIVTTAGHSVIEVSEVKRVNEAGIHPETMESGF